MLQAQFPTLTWRGLSTSHIPSLGTGVRAAAQGPLAVCIAAGRSVLPWSSRQPARPVGQLDLLPQGPQAPGQARLPELPPPWPASPHMVSISSLPG